LEWARKQSIAARVELKPACTSGQSRATPLSSVGCAAASISASGSASGRQPSSTRTLAVVAGDMPSTQAA
jgi:hypothetical protein